MKTKFDFPCAEIDNLKTYLYQIRLNKAETLAEYIST